MKTALYFGDSIMAADKKPFDYFAPSYNQEEMGQICVGYPTIIEEELGIKNGGNFAVGGHKIADQLPVILAHDFQGADLLVLTVGSNDFSQGTPMGELPKTTDTAFPETFCGLYCQALDHVFRSNPRIRVILMTPLHRSTLHRQGDVPKNAIDTFINGQTLGDFAEAISKIGRFFACPVADI